MGLDDERAKELPYIASMGIYVVSKHVMLDLLRDKFPGANDFGSEVIPGATTNLGLRVCTPSICLILRLRLRNHSCYCLSFVGAPNKLMCIIVLPAKFFRFRKHPDH